MSNLARVGDLEIDQDLDYQRREWFYQRIGWAVMALILLAALLGLVGRGPLSSAEARTPDGSLRLEYNRFLHHHNPDTIQIHVTEGTAQGGRLRLWLGQEYLKSIQIEQISPRPEAVVAEANRQTFVFRVADEGSAVTITINIQPDSRGVLSGRVGVAEGEPAQFWQFVYP